MATVAVESPADELVRRWGIPATRVRSFPAPGTATEDDARQNADRNGWPCELIAGTLVEKPMGLHEERLANEVQRRLGNYAHERQSGYVFGGTALVRLWDGRLVAPDVAYYPEEHLPPIDTGWPGIVTAHPALAVEVLSPSNTVAEMRDKRDEFFSAGTQLVWEFEPQLRAVPVYTRADAPDAILRSSDTLTGGDVLPGFTLPLSELFAVLDRLQRRTGKPPE